MSIYIKNLLSFFFYHFAKLITTEKIRAQGRVIASAYDLCSVMVAWLLAYWILIDTMGNISLDNIAQNLLWILPLQFLLFRLFGLYRGFWRFASVQDLWKILYVSMLGGMLVWMGLHEHLTLIPKHVIALLYSIFLVGFLSSARLLVRFSKDYKRFYDDCQRVIIIGAGNAGEGLVRDLLRDNTHRYKPVVFLDDDARKFGREIHGVRVSGTIADLPKFIKKFDINLVFIAIPSASSSSMRSVVDSCEKAKVACYTLPGIKDLANGRVSINILRSISLEDLVGRYPVTCQWESIKDNLKNKTVMITGGGGSIGSEICRQIAALGNLAQLVIIDSNEYNLYAIDIELRQRFPFSKFDTILLSVTDRVGMQAALAQYRPHMVFHAAAYKHVPLLEHQPRVAMFNNIIGTRVMAEEAVKAGVDIVVLISSDKAVNPTNIMGATKRASEYFCLNLNDEAHNTKFITVRFGNVLDSAGSVIPLFRKQIEAGGPVTVTHPEITRFFMTIPEASQLILQAAFLGQGGEIFVLDMGDPIKIRYLAEQMIKLAGKTIDRDIKIVYTGLRPGEKLFEECFYPDEMLQPTISAKILRAQSQKRDFMEIQNIVEQIEISCQLLNIDQRDLILLLKMLVPEYQSMPEISAKVSSI